MLRSIAEGKKRVGSSHGADKLTAALTGAGAGSLGGYGTSLAFGGEFRWEDMALSLGSSLAGSLASCGAKEWAEGGDRNNPSNKTVRSGVGCGRQETAAKTTAQFRARMINVRVDPQKGTTTFDVEVRINGRPQVQYFGNNNAQTPHPTDGTLGNHEQRHVTSLQEQYTTKGFDQNLAHAGARISPDGSWEVTGGRAEAVQQFNAMVDYHERYVQWYQDAVIDSYTSAPAPTFQGELDPLIPYLLRSFP